MKKKGSENISTGSICLFQMKFPCTNPICNVLGINAFDLNEGKKPLNNMMSLFWLSFYIRLSGTKCTAREGKKLV